MRNTMSAVLSVLLAALAIVLLAPAAGATPPSIPSAATARAELAALRVAAAGSMAGYSRDRFPHWISQGGGCDTRDVVLKRDGTGVESACTVQRGTWRSPYDGATWTAASDVDIDHIVPLAAAWRSGAAAWTDSRRQRSPTSSTAPSSSRSPTTSTRPRATRPPTSGARR